MKAKTTRASSPPVENKVQFNLKNVHYAVLTNPGDDAQAPAWDTPVHVPGAVSLTLDQQGEVTPFYADGIVYYQTAANNGYSGDLEMARFIDQMLMDVWGTILTADEVLVENSDVIPSAFALLFQIDGDQQGDYYCLYNCTGTRPGISSQTKTETTEPQTQTSTISAVSLPNGNVLARTTANTPEGVKATWFERVYTPEGGARIGTAKVGEAEV